MTPGFLKAMAAINFIVLALSAAGAFVLWFYFSPCLDRTAAKAESVSPRFYRATDPQQLQRIVHIDHEGNIEFLHESAAIGMDSAKLLGLFCFFTLMNGACFIILAQRSKTIAVTAEK